MKKKKINLGKELVKRTQDLNKNIETIVGKTVKPTKTFKIIDSDDIDELWETRITPLQNKVKDQHTQIESQYKRETKLQQQIKELEQLAKDQDNVISYVVGYLSACEQFRDKHPLTIKTWFFSGWKDDLCK